MLVRNLVLIAAASAAAVLAAPIDMPPHVGSGDPGTNPTNTSVLPDTRNMTLQSILSNVQIALAYNISTFADALSQDADLLDDFTDVSGSTTIFVPTDEAVVEFSLTRPLEAGRLLNNAAALRRFLLYHAVRYGIIVPQTMPTGRYFYKTASGGEYVRAQVDHNTTDLVSGNFTQTTTTLGLGFGFEARIVATLPSLNGIVHVIDAVLMQPMSLTTTLEYLGLVGVAGLIEGTNLTRSFNALRNVTL
nr:hypothetical protein HK105_008118 [Polyrhizophydium stewartii]